MSREGADSDPWRSRWPQADRERQDDDEGRWRRHRLVVDEERPGESRIPNHPDVRTAPTPGGPDAPCPRLPGLGEKRRAPDALLASTSVGAVRGHRSERSQPTPSVTRAQGAHICRAGRLAPMRPCPLGWALGAVCVGWRSDQRRLPGGVLHRGDDRAPDESGQGAICFPVDVASSQLLPGLCGTQFGQEVAEKGTQGPRCAPFWS